MKVSKSFLFVLILSIILIAGCGTRVTEEVVATAWSDDSTRIAFMQQRYVEDRYILFTSGIKEIKYRLGVADRNCESKHFITDYFPISKTGLVFILPIPRDLSVEQSYRINSTIRNNILPTPEFHN